MIRPSKISSRTASSHNIEPTFTCLSWLILDVALTTAVFLHLLFFFEHSLNPKKTGQHPTVSLHRDPWNSPPSLPRIIPPGNISSIKDPNVAPPREFTMPKSFKTDPKTPVKSGRNNGEFGKNWMDVCEVLSGLMFGSLPLVETKRPLPLSAKCLIPSYAFEYSDHSGQCLCLVLLCFVASFYLNNILSTRKLPSVNRLLPLRCHPVTSHPPTLQETSLNQTCQKGKLTLLTKMMLSMPKMCLSRFETSKKLLLNSLASPFSMVYMMDFRYPNPSETHVTLHPCGPHSFRRFRNVSLRRNPSPHLWWITRSASPVPTRDAACHNGRVPKWPSGGLDCTKKGLENFFWPNYIISPT